MLRFFSRFQADFLLTSGWIEPRLVGGSVFATMGWFFGFKLHLICNEKGELLNFMITPGDVDDRKPLEYKAFVEFIYGKLVGDKGYIGKRLFERLFVDGIFLSLIPHLTLPTKRIV